MEKNRRKKKYKVKKKTIVCLVFIMLVITSSILLARYYSSIQASSNKGIAKWDVSIDTNDNTSDELNLVAGNNTKSYIVKIKSTSSVSAIYSLVLSNLPDGVQVKVDSDEYKNPINNTVIFNNLGNFDINDNVVERVHTLTFSAPLDVTLPSVNEVSINVTFTQID